MATLLLGLCLAANAPEWAAVEVQRLIGTVGPYETLRELRRDDDAWQAVLSRIASGRPPWLAIGSVLHAISDKGDSSALAVALQDALREDPTAVLEIVEHGQLSARAVCGGHGSRLDGASPPAILAEISERKALIEQLRGRIHEPTRQRCLQELRLQELVMGARTGRAEPDKNALQQTRHG